MVEKGTTFSGFQNKMYCLRSGLNKKKNMLSFICILLSLLNYIFDVSGFLKLSGKNFFKKTPCLSENPIPLILFDLL